jgi:multidrug efflux pump subunit AcrB
VADRVFVLPSQLNLIFDRKSNQLQTMPAGGKRRGAAAMSAIDPKRTSKAVGNEISDLFALAILLVCFVLADQDESWLQPISVILAVPLALLGTVGALTMLGLANNL